MVRCLYCLEEATPSIPCDIQRLLHDDEITKTLVLDNKYSAYRDMHDFSHYFYTRYKEIFSRYHTLSNSEELRFKW